MSKSKHVVFEMGIIENAKSLFSEVGGGSMNWDDLTSSEQMNFLQSSANGFHYEDGVVFRWRGDGSVYHYRTMTPDRYALPPSLSLEETVRKRQEAVLMFLTGKVANIRNSIELFEKNAACAPDFIPEDVKDRERFMTAKRWRALIQTLENDLRSTEQRMVEFRRHLNL